VDEVQQAKVCAYKRLAARSHHSVELSALLKKRGFAEGVVEEVLNECQKFGYLNDPEWVEMAVRKEAERKKGPQAILQKLVSKGIPREEVEQALEVSDSSEAQKQRMFKLLETRYRNRNLEDFREREKVIAAFSRLGYNFDLIREVLASQVQNNEF